MAKRLRHLLLTTTEDPANVKSWSGIPYQLRAALERQVDRITVFGPSRPSRAPLDVVKRLWYGGHPPRYPLALTAATLKQNARELKQEIARVDPDAILSISSAPIAALHDAGRPVFLFSDAPYQAWHEAYEGTISRPVQLAAFVAQEASLVRRIEGSCFGSEWAVREAERLYADPLQDPDELRERLHVTPLGANWIPQGTRELLLQRVEERLDKPLALLYVGKDWERKGGPLAVEVTRLLNAAGHKTHLHVVGCRPSLPPETVPYVTVHGLLYQDDAAQSAQLAKLFEGCHFLIVPTTAECFGIVFAEAQAFALPPIARAVHALPTVVEDGVSGLLIDPSAPASAYVERILALRADPTAYRQMALRARERYETLLNWDKTAEELIRLMSTAVTNFGSNSNSN